MKSNKSFSKLYEDWRRLFEIEESQSENENIVNSRNPDIRSVIYDAKEDGKTVYGFDFHDTLVDVTDREDYEGVRPRNEMIDKLRSFYKKGIFIIIYTAASEKDRDMIMYQLEKFNIPYDVLITEKPRLDRMYDDKYIGPIKDWV
jgi:hypothetical protein